MKTIKLFGDLQKFKPVWELDVLTPSEALRAIEANRPGFIAAADKGEYVVLLIDENNPETARQITEVTALAPWHNEELWVIPKIGGDIPVVAVAAVLGVAATSATAIIVTTIINLVLTIALSMIASLISGTNDGMSVEQTEQPENKPSYLFNGAVNTVKQGHPIPLLYGGPLLIGSMVLSADLHTKDIPV